ncbi:MAG: hypothetical protein ACWGPR_08480 [Candidatus Deferrimicrobiaceae bacterium]
MLLLAAVLAAWTAGCGLIDRLPPTTVCSAQHVWNGYHLPTGSRAPTVINESSYALDLAAWNGLDQPITLHDGTGGDFPIYVRDGGDADSPWLGIARVSPGPDGHIGYAEVEMNRTLLERYPDAVAAHVLCQELGHVLGLDHQRGANDSCMEDCVGRGGGWFACMSSDAGRTPNAHDAEQLRAIYAHEDGHGDQPPVQCSGSVVLDSIGPGGI